MTDVKDTRNRLFQLSEEQDFNGLAIEIFHFQYLNNEIYREFCDILRVMPGAITDFRQVPFLPIGFFKHHRIVCGDRGRYEMIFTSSGTTGSIPSRHYIRDIGLYGESFLRSFSLYYGDPANYRFLVLLPGYLEREGSSLVYMMENFVSRTKENGSGFYLNDLAGLSKELQKDPPPGIRTILFGASYALLDFAESRYSVPVNGIVMETGGMKGRKREMVREELHGILRSALNMDVIHSEYGMTELLSQAYSSGDGLYRTPPWMKVLSRDTNDPLEILPAGKTGGINIIDLANLYSCSFISTQDLGKVYADGSFEILGRFDDSDIRGCNLMVI